jgi:malate/lactate dehydrogenase
MDIAVIGAGGGTIPVNKGGVAVSRDFLSEQNAPIFERYASALAKNGHGNEIVICVSNPNELAVARLAPLIETGRIREAYHMVDGYPPDFRVALKPFVTHYSGSKTVTGTARATVELIRMITLGSDALISGQISLEGEFHGIRGTLGLPFVVGNQGVDRVIELELSPGEKDLLVSCAESVQKKLERFNPDLR